MLKFQIHLKGQFCQTFEKLFIICVEILINLKVQLSRFEWQTFHGSDFKLKSSRHHTRLFHNIDIILFIIFYNHYHSKSSELKKPGAKVKILNLNNYLTICCWNGKNTTVIIHSSRKMPVEMHGGLKCAPYSGMDCCTESITPKARANSACWISHPGRFCQQNKTPFAFNNREWGAIWGRLCQVPPLLGPPTRLAMEGFSCRICLNQPIL